MGRPAAAAVLGALLAACNPGEPASQPRQDAPYDFLVLSLSWSPSYCEVEGKDANRQQCGARRPHAFVVHGLWPQFESGWPEFCPSDEPARVPDSLVRDLLDIMPSAGLIGHQWRKHGSCTGMNQRDYFSLVREAYEKVTVPQRFEQTRAPGTIAPDDVEKAFLDANADLAADGVAATCNEGYIAEVRICLAKDLSFRSCPEIDARGCRLPRAAMPAPGR